MASDPDLVRGTLNTLLLEVISRRPMYGYEICKAVNVKTDGYFDLREGSLYPALHRLEREGLLRSFWEKAETRRRRKYYEITELGLSGLERKRQEWKQFASAVERVLATFGPARDVPLNVNPIG